MKLKTPTGDETMSMQICIDMGEYNWLVDNKDPKEIELKLIKGLLLQEYIDGEISIGEVAEHTGRTIEEAMDWLHVSGINTSRLMAVELEKIAENNLIEHMKGLGIPYNPSK